MITTTHSHMPWTDKGGHVSGSEGFWIGLKEGDLEGRYSWISGEQAAYRNWADGDPNNFAGVEDSVLLFGFTQGGPYQAGTWVDLPDSGFAGYVYRGIVEVKEQKNQITQQQNNTAIRLSKISTDFNAPVGIDYYEPSDSLIISANYNNGGRPNTLERILRDGAHEQFSNISGVGDEIKIATAKSGCLASQFTPGDVFIGNGVDGQIIRITDNGQTVINPWVDLPGANGLMRGSLYVDQTGVFNGDLIAVTTGGQVWRINSNRDTTLLAQVGTHLEGLSTIPNDPVKYGPLAGKILAGAEQQGRLYIRAPRKLLSGLDFGGIMATITQ